MAGGVALNCTMNGKIQSETPFERVYIQPAAYDAGTSLGAALYVKHQMLGAPRDFVMDHTYWGLEYSREACRAALDCARSPLSTSSPTNRWPTRRPTSSPRATSSGGIRAASSGGRVRSATAASSAIRATPR